MQHDHIGYRYEVLSYLGKGSFGQVLKCYDHKTKRMQALKIISREDDEAGLLELQILESIRQNDGHGRGKVIHMEERFFFRGHLCMTFELLSINLEVALAQQNHQVMLSLICDLPITFSSEGSWKEEYLNT